MIFGQFGTFYFGLAHSGFQPFNYCSLSYLGTGKNAWERAPLAGRPAQVAMYSTCTSDSTPLRNAHMYTCLGIPSAAGSDGRGSVLSGTGPGQEEEPAGTVSSHLQVSHLC